MREGIYNFIVMGAFVAAIWYVIVADIDKSLLNDPFICISIVAGGIIVALVFKSISERSFNKDMKNIKRGIMK
jgi:undecaprenyl pyrophosphate phosphatase UppP